MAKHSEDQAIDEMYERVHKGRESRTPAQNWEVDRCVEISTAIDNLGRASSLISSEREPVKYQRALQLVTQVQRNLAEMQGKLTARAMQEAAGELS